MSRRETTEKLLDAYDEACINPARSCMEPRDALLDFCCPEPCPDRCAEAERLLEVLRCAEAAYETFRSVPPARVRPSTFEVRGAVNTAREAFLDFCEPAPCPDRRAEAERLLQAYNHDHTNDRSESVKALLDFCEPAPPVLNSERVSALENAAHLCRIHGRSGGGLILESGEHVDLPSVARTLDGILTGPVIFDHEVPKPVFSPAEVSALAESATFLRASIPVDNPNTRFSEVADVLDGIREGAVVQEPGPVGLWPEEIVALGEAADILRLRIVQKARARARARASVLSQMGESEVARFHEGYAKALDGIRERGVVQEPVSLSPLQLGIVERAIYWLSERRGGEDAQRNCAEDLGKMISGDLDGQTWSSLLKERDSLKLEVATLGRQIIDQKYALAAAGVQEPGPTFAAVVADRDRLEAEVIDLKSRGVVLLVERDALEAENESLKDVIKRQNKSIAEMTSEYDRLAGELLIAEKEATKAVCEASESAPAELGELLRAVQGMAFDYERLKMQRDQLLYREQRTRANQDLDHAAGEMRVAREAVEKAFAARKPAEPS